MLPDIERINSFSLGWTAGLTPHNLGKRVKDFATGLIPLPPNQRMLMLGKILSGDGPAPGSGTRTLAADDSDASRAAGPPPPLTYRSPPSSLSGALTQAAAAAPGSAASASAPAPAGARRDADPFAPPAAYDARDTYAGQLPCDSFTPLDQSNCDSCYAFGVVSSYSARVCALSRTSLGNVVISPQQLIDCNGGCGGSDEITTFNSLATRPPVENW